MESYSLCAFHDNAHLKDNRGKIVRRQALKGTGLNQLFCLLIQKLYTAKEERKIKEGLIAAADVSESVRMFFTQHGTVTPH